MIKNDIEYTELLQELETLWNSTNQFDAEQAERLNVLADLLDEYEKMKFPIGPPSEEEAAQFRKEQEG